MSDENDQDDPDPRRARKERVLHTRVPELLADELKRAAEAMRVPVSNLVRSALEDAVDALSAVNRRTEEELHHLASRLPGSSNAGADPHRSPAPEASTPAPPLAGIIGFQPMILAQDASCALCGRSLRAGEDAFLGIRDGEGPLVIVNAECVPGGLRTKNAD